MCTALLLIDRLGRRPLLVAGSAVCCLAMLAIAAGDATADAMLLLAGMCTFIVAFRHVCKLLKPFCLQPLRVPFTCKRRPLVSDRAQAAP